MLTLKRLLFSFASLAVFARVTMLVMRAEAHLPGRSEDQPDYRYTYSYTEADLLDTYLPIVQHIGTIACGEIDTDTTWGIANNPYLINCDVTVPAGVSLTIEAGVLVQFEHVADDLIISGTLKTAGTEMAPIRFQPRDRTNTWCWGEVAFRAGSSGVLDHTIFEYGGCADGTVYIASDEVQVLNTVVQGSMNTGILIHAASPLISATQIISGTSHGLYNDSGSPTIQNNIIKNNKTYGGVDEIDMMYPALGGGLYNDTGSPIIQNNTFAGNAALGNSSYTVTGRSAGGGLYNASGNPIIQNNIISGNTVLNTSSHYGYGYGEGGGLYNGQGNPIIQNNLIFSNTAIVYGFFTYDPYAGSGGGLYNDSGSAIIRSNIVISNTAYGGGGGIVNVVSASYQDYNDAWNNTGGDYSSITQGAHDISLDPLLVNPIGGDYHLSPDSPCIDAGDPDGYPNTDYEGDPRPMGTAPDIGGDEYRTLGVKKTAAPDEASPGDLITYGLKLYNLGSSTLTNVLLIDTIPLETKYKSYQSDGLTCTHDGSDWGGQFSCTLDSVSLAPGESRTLIITVKLKNDLPAYVEVVNPVMVTASAIGETYNASDRVRTWVSNCLVRLNKTPMGKDLQAAIDASMLTTDAVKVSGYCRVHDLNLDKTLILQGGWNEDFTHRNTDLYPTTIDGQSLGRVVGVQGDVNPIIEGFTITGGMSGTGGGIYVSSGSPIIQNNIFIDNASNTGGGLYNDSGSPLIQNNTFITNTASGSGGGLYTYAGSPTIQNNTFSDNSAYNGGGLYKDNYSIPIIQDNTFSGNSASYGGGLFTFYRDITIQNNTFLNNSARVYGGGLYNYGMNNPTIQNNTFLGNTATRGGGLYLYYSYGIVQNNAFIANSAIEGGGLYNEFGYSTIQNNTFSGNTATENGGGVNITGGDPAIRSNIIINNTAGNAGGGIFSISEYSIPTLDYNDLWNNTGGNYYDVNPGAHDISADPLLADIASGDFHLSSGSPCIDAGDPDNYPETDFEGDDRPQGPAPDIGADEYTSKGEAFAR
jgi:uncharacterized repeat protein (TIGR01451 family)